MFNFFKKSQSRQPTPALCRALAAEGLPPGMDPSSLRVALKRGLYSGRHVKYFRVFDAIRVAECGVEVRGYADLDTHADLVLGSGHFEPDGAVVLSKRDRPEVTAPSVRSEADRTAHGDDEQFVFPVSSAPRTTSGTPDTE
jgi:hypothetical protein